MLFCPQPVLSSNTVWPCDRIRNRNPSTALLRKIILRFSDRLVVSTVVQVPIPRSSDTPTSVRRHTATPTARTRMHQLRNVGRVYRHLKRLGTCQQE
jgi:hypothetical protein